MAGRHQYSSRQMAQGYLAIELHQGSVAKASRDCGIPKQTLFNWKQAWEKDGLPKELIAEMQIERGDALNEMIHVRDKAIRRLGSMVERATSARELATVVGILDDKIHRMKAMNPVEKPRQDVSPEDVRSALGDMLLDAIGAAAERRRDIVEVEVVEEDTAPAELPAIIPT